ncbi:MAG: ABC transporter ATP-binding protein [Streptococcus anginosus]|nr:ABC transporter ATP-binding protein [Streptococcus anginosus]MDU1664504.1 ABC transporter ATP-binding protein [Peptoniphilus harei]
MDLIKKYVKKRKGQYFVSVTLAIFSVVANLFSYIYLAKIIVALIEEIKDISFYFDCCMIILCMYALKEIAAGISTTVSHTATFHSLGEIREDISKKLFRMPLGEILSRSSGELKNIIIEQVDSMETSLAHLVPEFTANLVGPVLLLVYMFILDWRLALLSLVPFAIGMSIMMGTMNEHYKEMYAKSVKIGQKMNNSIVEYIGGIEVIKTFNQSENSYKKYSDSVYDNAKFFYNWMGESMTKVAIGRLLSPMGILTVIPFGVFFYIHGSISLPSLITLVVLSFATVSSLVKIMNYMDDLSRISTITGEIGKILDSRELENKDKKEDVKSYDIALKNVEFSYDEDNKVIKDISLEIDEDSVSAFVGASGSGKSTLAKLIAGFWNVDKGEIRIGGIETRDMSLESLSSLISYVSQDNFLFDLSVRENIRIGRKDASDEEIEEIAKKSGCHDFIMSLSNGYDTVVGEGGGHLSGGERQRISIARAMLKNAPIVILDEATSYIDPENEGIIQEALGNLVKGKTLLIIAHRLKTITNVDRIFVIKDGRLESFGRHEELMEKSDLYKQMVIASVRGEN